MPSTSPSAHLRWNVLAIAALVGVAVVVIAWWVGPGLFGTSTRSEGAVVEATVTRPVPCTDGGAQEAVRFELAGQSREGTLNGCGHGQDERLSVAVPDDAGAGPVAVSLAGLSQGHGELRRPVGLALVALSCFSGGMYAFLVVRGPRPRALAPG
ncbi:hypothetical protein [Amycolatopsis anabasis]|uniref:hypothetical protein n=1 Tax=Amycolatopsis anabasis TaxID=1840409 RepID=UPI001FEAC766|nr:hypothetical protein [Amycolatopsis anabasis]